MPLSGSPSTGAWPGLKAKGSRGLIQAMKREQLQTGCSLLFLAAQL